MTCKKKVPADEQAYKETYICKEWWYEEEIRKKQ